MNWVFNSLHSTLFSWHCKPEKLYTTMFLQQNNNFLKLAKHSLNAHLHAQVMMYKNWKQADWTGKQNCLVGALQRVIHPFTEHRWHRWGVCTELKEYWKTKRNRKHVTAVSQSDYRAASCHYVSILLRHWWFCTSEDSHWRAAHTTGCSNSSGCCWLMETVQYGLFFFQTFKQTAGYCFKTSFSSSYHCSLKCSNINESFPTRFLIWVTH